MQVENSAATETVEQPVMSNKRLAATAATPLLLPFGIIGATMFLMLIGIGWLLVGMSFFCTAAAAAVGIVGMIGAYLNMANGLAASLIMLAIAGCGLGLVYPLFSISISFGGSFRLLSAELWAKGRQLKQKVVGQYE